MNIICESKQLYVVSFAFSFLFHLKIKKSLNLKFVVQIEIIRYKMNNKKYFWIEYILKKYELNFQ